MKIASAERGAGRYVLGFEYPRVPPGLKIDTDDPAGVTRNLKKAATFFGAALVGVCRLDN